MKRLLIWTGGQTAGTGCREQTGPSGVSGSSSEVRWSRTTGKRVFGLVTVLALMATGCGERRTGRSPTVVPTEVVMERPSLTAVEELVVAVGTVDANERVELKPETSGVVEAVHFIEGQHVQEGQLLFELNSQKEAANYAQADTEEKLAQVNLSRARALVGSQVIAQQEIDHLESQGSVKAAIKRVEKEKLAERRIAAPFAGVLGSRLVSPGQYVTAGASLATLVDSSRVKVRFRVPERQLSLLQVNQEARLRVSAHPDQTFAGRVDLISPEVDQTTRTVELRLVVPNQEGLLKPGMFARVELAVGLREQSIVVPETALIPSLDKFSVYVVEEGLAKLRSVKLGTRLPGKAEIREGLTAEQFVVVSGTQKLMDGMKVVAAKPLASAKLSGARETRH